MATLKKLVIGGVRSFGADDADHQYINFDKPFTLILGRNGCGKTTVIEALKYACTGTFPAGQGSSFVRDPKIDRRVETRAQIKLNFLSCQGQDSVVARLLQSTQKVKNISTTAMDASISVLNKNGTKKTQVSGRCADIDDLMIQHLGVSKPILNYVIFCHQEDSHWPLDEGKKVKERFDEIFDSTKYNKCMEEIRKIRNKIIGDLKVEKVKLNNLEQINTTRKGKEGALELLIKERDQLKSRIDELTDQSKEARQEYNSLNKRLEAYKAIEKQKDLIENELNGLINRQGTHKSFISVLFTGTEEELEETIKNFDAELAGKKKRLDDIEHDKRRVDQTEQMTLQEKSNIENKLGKLEADMSHEKKTKEERNSNLSSLALALGLSGLTKGASENEVNDLTNQVRKEINSLVNSISSLKIANEREQNAIQREIQSHRDSKTKIEAEISMKNESMRQNYKEIEEKEQLLNSVNSKLAQKEEIERELERYNERRERALQEEDPHALSSAIAKLKNETEKLEGQQNKLSTEVREIAKHQDLRTKLENHKEKINQNQATIRRLRSKNEDFISNHMKDSDDKDFKLDFDKLVMKLRKDLDKLNDKCLERKKEESSLQKDLDINRTLLRKKKEELDRCKDKIYAECRSKDLDAALKEVKESIDRFQNDKGLYTSSAVVIKGYIKDLKKQEPCCPLCERHFDDEDQPLNLVRGLEFKVSALPEKLDEVTRKLSEIQSRHERLLQLKPLQDTIIELQSTVIPNLEAAISHCEDRLGEVNGLIACDESSKNEVTEDWTRAENMRSDVHSIDLCQKECKALSKEMEKLKQEQPFNASSRNLDEALGEQEAVRVDLLAKRKDKANLEDRLRKYEKMINEVNQKINALTAEQLKIKEFIQQEDSLRERVEDLKTLNSALENEKEELHLKLKPICEEQRLAENKLFEVRDQHKKNLESKEREKGEREKDMGVIVKMQKDLNIFKSKNISENIRQCKSENQILATKLEEIKEEREQLNQESIALSSVIDNHSRERKELEENLKLMDVEKKIVAQKIKLKEKDEELGSLNYKSIEDKLINAQKNYQTLVFKANNKEGELKGKDENIASRQKELNQDIYRNAEQKYKEQFVEVEVMKNVEKDLQKYFNALDHAIQKFHQDRMDAVNRSIREYWRLIYKGNDIDHIEIKTDESTMSSTSASDKRRVYNYRVVQVKNGTEIDMKGRCSAGQKVLASLIIRMALSEHFSMNCGILTLDEPTTNLDKENIQSLCQAISSIVNDREGSKHFQLVVITHDNEFLNTMSTVDSFPHYWEVSRNAQCKSQIKMKEVRR